MSDAAREQIDARFMAAAVRLSRRHERLTGINPSVGCLLVRDGVVVGAAVTAPADWNDAKQSAAVQEGREIVRGGRPHAERVALAIAGERARGATAYVTLEPCAHHGHTPPCANALFEAGILRVVIGTGDPDERVSGRGIAVLRNGGVDVRVGVLQQECRDQLASFLVPMRLARPHVLLKLAVSPNGWLGRSDVPNLAITGRIAQRQVHLMRARSDAIVVGSGTALLDQPRLDVRLPGMGDRSPSRFVLDRSGRYAQSGAGHREASGKVIAASPAKFLRARHEADCRSVMVEGGAAIARSFLEADLVDEIALFVGALEVDGNVASPLPPDHVPAGFRRVREDQFGADRLISMRRDRDVHRDRH